MKTMRVLIIRNAYQQDTGGAEQYSLNLARALRTAGHKPILVTKHEAIKKQASKRRIPAIKSVWYEKQEWDRWYYARRAYTTLWYIWIILTRRIHVVNPQSRDDFVFATNAAKILRRRVIWTDHADLKYLMDRVNHYHPRMQIWLLKAAQHAVGIICVSQSEKEAILSVVPEFNDKLVVIHNGVFKPESTKPVKKERFVIGTNSRLVATKGIKELLEAFAKAQIEIPGSELWLLGGESGNREYYEQLANRLNIAKSVKFLGYVPNPNDYTASMDIFVHASHHEAFSLAIIEAAMLGRPIIATRVGGTPEIIKDKINGILVPPRNSNKLSLALRKLMEDPGLAKRLGVAAKKRAEDEFEFQDITEKKIIPLLGGFS